MRRTAPKPPPAPVVHGEVAAVAPVRRPRWAPYFDLSVGPIGERRARSTSIRARSRSFRRASWPGLRGDVTLNPLAGTWNRAGGVFSGSGSAPRVDKPFWPDSTLEAGSDDEVRDERAARRGRAALAHRPVQGGAAAAAAASQAGGGLHSFAIGKDADRLPTSGPPDVSYKYVTLRRRAARALRRVGVDLGDVRLSRRPRPRADRRRRRPSTGRPRASAFACAAGSTSSSTRASRSAPKGSTSASALTFDPTAAAAPAKIANSGTDQYFGGVIVVGYVL